MPSPHDLDAERHVLGCLLIDSEALSHALPVLGSRPKVFFKAGHQIIYRACLELATEGCPLDLYTVTERLKTKGDLQRVGNVKYLYDLQESVPTAANIEYYAGIVHEHHLRRELINAGDGIVNYARSPELPVEDLIDKAQTLVFGIEQDEVRRERAHEVTVRDAVEAVEFAYKNKSDLRGMPTGYPALDRMLSGLVASDLIIVAARPAMGKSAFAHNIALNLLLREHVPVALITLEMSAESIWTRMLATECHINMSRLQAGKLSAAEWLRLADMSDRFKGLPLLTVDSSAISIMEIRSECRRLKLLNPELGLIIVDYMQLLGGGSAKASSREQEVAEFSRALKSLARELDVPIMALSQLNRGVEMRDNKRPQLSDLRESGAIEQDADVVLFLYRDDYYFGDGSSMPGMVEVRIAKHRNGPTGVVLVRFQEECLLFDPLESYGYD